MRARWSFRHGDRVNASRWGAPLGVTPAGRYATSPTPATPPKPPGPCRTGAIRLSERRGKIVGLFDFLKKKSVPPAAGSAAPPMDKKIAGPAKVAGDKRAQTY